MLDKIMGFLSIKGWKGVENIYTLVVVGTIIGMGLLYYFLIYQKEYKPQRLTPIQLIVVKIVFLVTVLVLLLIY